MSKAEVQRRRKALGLRSQNDLARRIRVDSGLLSRVLRREVDSPRVWRRLHRFFAREESRRAAPIDPGLSGAA